VTVFGQKKEGRCGYRVRAVTVFGRHLDKGNCQDCTQ